MIGDGRSVRSAHVEIKNLTRQTLGDEEYQRRRHYFAALSIGGFPFVGTPDRVAEQFANFSRGGVRGVAFSQVNYLNEFPYFRDEVLPRLENMGIREKR
jgi:alkanesulfonate monooxygenase SsuD/methylene tetrahydromethanopterin reductase-like flavin-dependent oxidoreductase (luciferase family)